MHIYFILDQTTLLRVPLLIGNGGGHIYSPLEKIIFVSFLVESIEVCITVRRSFRSLDNVELIERELYTSSQLLNTSSELS